MKLHFTLTLEDFTTAQRLHRKPAPGAGPRMRERLLFLWLFLGAVFAVIAIAVGEGIYRAASGTLGRQARAADWMVHIVVQWSMYVLIFGFIWFGLSAWMDPRERGAYRRVIVILLSLLLLNSTVTTLITGLPPKQPQPTVVEGSSDGGWLLPLTPWLIILGYFWYIAFRYMRGAVRRAWEAQSNLHRPETIEVTEHGIRFDDSLCVRDYRWEAFTKWREDDAVFVLYISEVAFHVIPKRAMEPADVEALRRLLFERVKPVDYAPLGFPVPAIPLPAPPLPVAADGGR